MMVTVADASSSSSATKIVAWRLPLKGDETKRCNESYIYIYYICLHLWRCTTVNDICVCMWYGGFTLLQCLLYVWVCFWPAQIIDIGRTGQWIYEDAWLEKSRFQRETLMFENVHVPAIWISCLVHSWVLGEYKPWLNSVVHSPLAMLMKLHKWWDAPLKIHMEQGRNC